MLSEYPLSNVATAFLLQAKSKLISNHPYCPRHQSLAVTPSAKTPTMIRIAPATLANPKPPDAGLGGAPGSKANNQHTKLNQAITPVRTPQ